MMSGKKRFAVLKSPANRVILSTLGWEWQETANAIVFEGDERDIKILADVIEQLGYAHNPAYALQLAKSFFLNPLE
jgi:hypothetical protein